MAKVNNKALIEGLSGNSDTQPIFRHLRKGRTGSRLCPAGGRNRAHLQGTRTKYLFRSLQSRLL
jgi:hypothetical protein